MAVFSRREGTGLVEFVGGLLAASVALVLMLRISPVMTGVTLATSVAFALVLHRLWIRAGRPLGVSEVERLAEAELAEAP
jgi:hypothetical protein